MLLIVNDPVVAVELTAVDKSVQVTPLSVLPCNLKVFPAPLEIAQLIKSSCTPEIAIDPRTFGLILNNSFPTQLILGLNAEKEVFKLSIARIGLLLL